MIRPAALLLAPLLMAQSAPGLFRIGAEPFAAAEIIDARAVPTLDGDAAIMLTFAPAAAKRLAKISRASLGKPLPLTLDGEPLTTLLPREPIEQGVLEISGGFATSEAEALAKRISGKEPLREDLEE